MSKTNFVFVFLFFTGFVGLSTFASEKPVLKTTSTINEVTVFLQGATISRTANVTLQDGVNTIVLEGLSPKILSNSIQVTGLGDATILSINFGINYLVDQEQTQQYKELENELEQLQKQKNTIQNTISGYERELSLLSKNDRINSDQTSLSLNNLQQIATYYRERSTAINNAIYEQNERIKDLNKQINKLLQEMNKIDNQQDEELGEITLKLQSTGAARLKLGFSYIVNDAGWYPFYDIKAESTDAPINLDYKAKVYQQTGRNWDDVKLILSTGDPYTNNIKPDLGPLYLQFVSSTYRSKSAVSSANYRYNPTVRYVSGIVTDASGMPLPGATVLISGTSQGAQTDLDGRYVLNVSNTEAKDLSFSYIGFETKKVPVFANTMNVQLEESSESLEEVVVVGYGEKKKGKGEMGIQIRGVSSISKELQGQVAGIAIDDYNENVESKTESLTTTRFEIKKRYTIASNQDVTTIEIDNFEIPASYQHYAAPVINENVFLTATITDWEKYDLLQGEANVYFEGSYAGKTEISPLATTDSLEVSLGIDPNIIVKREKLDDFKDRSFLGSNRIVNQGFEIEVKNNKSIPVKMLLEDRIPVSQNGEIKVDDQEPGSANYNEETGILKWNLELEPKAVSKQQFSYEVRYPKNRRINLQ